MITVEELAIFRDQDPDHPYLSGSGVVWRSAEKPELSGPSFPTAMTEAISLLGHEWAAVLQMPGFVLALEDSSDITYRLLADGAELGHVELLGWYQSDLPNRAGVALLYGRSVVPAALMAEAS